MNADVHVFHRIVRHRGCRVLWQVFQMVMSGTCKIDKKRRATIHRRAARIPGSDWNHSAGSMSPSSMGHIVRAVSFDYATCRSPKAYESRVWDTNMRLMNRTQI